MKCSHTFNLLDARGAISVTERAAYIGRVRALARAVAQAYHDSRQALGFPMCGPAPGGNEMNDTVLIELRCEELPPKSLKPSPKPSPTAFFPPSSAGVRRGQRVHALRHPAPAGADDHRGCRPPARPRAGKERPGGCRCARRGRQADESARRLHARGRRDFRTSCRRWLTARASTSLPARKEGRAARGASRRDRRPGAEEAADSESHALGRLRAPVRAPGAWPDPAARRPCRCRRSARAASGRTTIGHRFLSAGEIVIDHPTSMSPARPGKVIASVCRAAGVDRRAARRRRQANSMPASTLPRACSTR
jgi:hypothetical protein